MRTLPPLTAVRAFEAAARHQSFNRAADELHVTPSAVSHQIASLESFLGVRLFYRRTRRVSLTPEGQSYLPPVQHALDAIGTATERLISAGHAGPLTMNVVPSFANRWLVPRLPGFQMLHPDLEVRLITSVRMVDFERSDVDLAIRRGSGDWPGLHAHELMSVQLVPVCSPALLERAGPLHGPADLGRLTLIHVLPRLGEWRAWLDLCGVKDVDAERGPKFLTYLLALDAAVAGLGVAILDRHLVEEELKSGRLLIPFDIEPEEESAYYLVYPEDRTESKKVAAFRDWLLAEVTKEGTPRTGLLDK